jgi:translation initiation factor 3 subunit B
MSSVSNLVDQRLEEDEDLPEDLADYLSDGEGEIEEPMEMDKSFPESVFICNVPKVGKEKLEKLKSVIKKIIDKCGEHTLHMPVNEEANATYGFVIATFDSKSVADDAAKKLDGMSLDKIHTFKCVKLDDFDQICRRPEEFNPKNNIQRPSRVDHREWLTDEVTREQFLLRYGAETEIYWHDTLAGEPVLYYGGEREKAVGKIWCDWKVQFSPQGSFIATFHKQGIALWAGDQFTKWLVRFPHEGVKYIQFSPNEEFLLTWNGAEPGKDNAVRIFRVLSGETKRNCPTPVVSPTNPSSEKDIFPHFLWSNDGKYFAECNESTIFVRDTISFDFIKDDEGRKRTMKYENLHTFQWSPKDNIIALWTLERDNNPARLVLVEIPSRRELAARSRTQVDAKMYWQSEGDFLCLLVEKKNKSKKTVATNLEIFCLREKNIPVDIVEVRDTVKHFSWETGGNRFAIITTDDSGHKPKILFYQLVNAKCEQVNKLDLPSIGSDQRLYWAPHGQYFVSAAMQDGDLIFGGLMPDNKLEILQRDEHFMVTDVKWDPSSRYVITAVTQPHAGEGGGIKYQMEAGYALWTFQGRQLHKQQKEKLYLIDWRPHPPSLLSKKEQGSIKTKLKEYSRKYDARDEKAKETAREEFRRDRQSRTDEFLDILGRIDDYKADKEEELDWPNPMADKPDEYWEKVETTMEEELDATEELIQ